MTIPDFQHRVEIDDHPDDQRSRDDEYFEQLARHAFTHSTQYIETNIRKDWIKCANHQNNKHSQTSKYNRPEYFYRSKTFRPKTRTNNLLSEAKFALAAFSTTDVVDIEAVDPDNAEQVLSAEINQYLLQHRLTKTIPWFQIACGAWSDTRVYGVAYSYQSWETRYVKDSHDTVSMVSEPVVELIPPENIRFDPNADWTDPVNKSPYLIRRVPLHATRALELINDKRKNQEPWYDFDIDELISYGAEQQHDETRRQREGQGRNDPAQSTTETEFDIVWLHENFMCIDGVDWHFWTIGASKMLSKPRPVSEVFPHLRPFERPIVAGCCMIEPHKNYPSSPTLLIAPLQEDSNDIANQRFDNVKLVLNKRYFLRQNAVDVDMQALTRNAPGSVVTMADPDRDVRIVDTPDITASSYQEQDRIDLAIDETTGAFSQQTVQNNRNLNETVGGMQMMNSGADSVSEYMIRVFIETWMEPVVRQLVRLEQMYESDRTILSIAAQKAHSYQNYAGNENIWTILEQELTVNVNIGFGATNPQKKIEKLMLGLNAVINLPEAAARINTDEVIKEVFGTLGYRDAQRFFKSLEEMQQQQQQPSPEQMDAQMKQAEIQARLQQAQLESQTRIQIEQIESQSRMQIEMAKLAIEKEIKLEELYRKLGIEQMKLQTQRDIEAGKQTLEQTKQVMQHNNIKAGYDTF